MLRGPALPWANTRAIAGVRDVAARRTGTGFCCSPKSKGSVKDARGEESNIIHRRSLDAVRGPDDLDDVAGLDLDVVECDACCRVPVEVVCQLSHIGVSKVQCILDLQNMNCKYDCEYAAKVEEKTRTAYLMTELQLFVANPFADCLVI